MTRTALSLLLFILLLPAIANAAGGDFPRDEQQVYLMGASHDWKDLDPADGTSVTDDKGISFGAGWEGQFEGGGWSGFWRTRLQGYKGSSDYTEKARYGEITANTSLSGMSAGIDYIFRIPSSRYFAIEPVAGMALRMDRRVIGGGTVGSDNAISRRGRYREERRGFCARLGVRGVVRELGGAGDERTLTEGSSRDLFLEGGLLVPVYMVYQGGLNGDRLPTKLYPGLYFEAGARLGRWQPAVYYEGFRYGKGYSFSGDLTAQSDVLGVRLGMTF